MPSRSHLPATPPRTTKSFFSALWLTCDPRYRARTIYGLPIADVAYDRVDGFFWPEDGHLLEQQEEFCARKHVSSRKPREQGMRYSSSREDPRSQSTTLGRRCWLTMSTLCLCRRRCNFQGWRNVMARPRRYCGKRTKVQTLGKARAG